MMGVKWVGSMRVAGPRAHRQGARNEMHNTAKVATKCGLSELQSQLQPATCLTLQETGTCKGMSGDASGTHV